MKSVTDKNYKAPPGLAPCLGYDKDIPEGLPIVGLATLPGTMFRFWVGEDNSLAPAMPILHKGEIRHMGWDIATKWAIDSNLQCYLGGSHGEDLQRVEPKFLLQEMEEEGEPANWVRKLFGMKECFARWMEQALEAGWTPPPGWKREDYE